jgi:hypothetical protein
MEGKCAKAQATQNPLEAGGTQDIFALARQMESLLEGQSYRTVLKVMNMVGSQHGIKSMHIDKVMSLKTTTVVSPSHPKSKGVATKADWKQTADYRQLTAQRASVVSALKKTGSDLDAGLVAELRALEQSLRNLRPAVAGDRLSQP